ncbi:2-hydroxyacid dehydrogenase [Robertmurraya kyonggiensis]|uniref:D-glycerate dehydrogenase n=1 Tax=Robertmurraya kyonggiensis TaxID=1037680 RepID=A0A4U1D9B8_9BACI|nr:D-glycerate dehydrogenase [Robertmurraya kyonggiensis]TKC18107.1 D-glycerate dehydrogenase [Robertmurraya kyonggiensis]
MTKNLVICKRVPESILNELESQFHVSYYPNGEELENPIFVEKLLEADGILGPKMANINLLEKAPRVKIISNISVGYNNLDIELLTKRRIMATNTPDVLTDTTADTMFGILLAAARRIAELDRFVKQGKWKATITEEHFGIEVHHKTIGIIGMGRIGEAIAKRAHFGFDMDVLYYNRTRKKEAEQKYDATYCQLDELLTRSDFVVLMTPLTEETRGMIGLHEFSLMKKTAIFINSSRGETVKEADLVQALQQKLIRGAALDVYSKEPIEPDHPLLSFENVVTVPHIGSATKETRDKMASLASENIRLGLEGKVPPNVINPEVFQLGG